MVKVEANGVLSLKLAFAGLPAAAMNLVPECGVHVIDPQVRRLAISAQSGFVSAFCAYRRSDRVAAVLGMWAPRSILRRAYVPCAQDCLAAHDRHKVMKALQTTFALCRSP